MQYQLSGLRENGLFVSTLKGQEKHGQFTVRWSLELDLSLPSTNELHVEIKATIRANDGAQQPVIGQFSATHFFRLTDAPVLDEVLTDQQASNFYATLVGISLGTLRGLCYARTFNVLGPGVFMPVINPTKFLHNSLRQKNQQVSPREQ
ncbi:MAG: hypothetical protein AAFZ52_08660 [Bacteroidota bacterium]